MIFLNIFCKDIFPKSLPQGERYYCYQFTVPHDFKPRVTVTHTRFRRVFTVKSYSPPSPTPVVRRPVSPPRRIVPRPSPPKDLEPPVVADANPVSPPSGSALGAGSPATVDGRKEIVAARRLWTVGRKLQAPAQFVPAPRARGQGRDHARRRVLVRSNADVVVLVGRLL